MDRFTIPLEKAADLTPVSSEKDTFTNASPLWSFAGGFGVFGGSTVAQCLVAAQKTVSQDYVAHSVHCNFVSSTKPTPPVEYRVQRTRDGKTFSTRTVQATQSGGVIATAIANFVRVGTSSKNGSTSQERSVEHARQMPQGLQLPDEPKLEGKGIDGPFETRWGEILNQRSHDCTHTQIRYWMRAKHPIQQSGPAAQLAALAYMSDAYMLATVFQVGDRPTKAAMAASLNHTIYFHHPEAVRTDQWMSSERESPWAGNDRVLIVQRIWSATGILVATCVQEAMVRVQGPSEKGKL